MRNQSARRFGQHQARRQEYNDKAAWLRRVSIPRDGRRLIRKQAGMPMTDTVAMPQPWYRGLTRHQWNILLAANLGWLFDGFELFALFLTVGPAMRHRDRLGMGDRFVDDGRAVARSCSRPRRRLHAMWHRHRQLPRVLCMALCWRTRPRVLAVLVSHRHPAGAADIVDPHVDP